MRTHNIKAILNSAVRVIGLLLFGAVAAFGQAQQVNLTAGPTTLVMPDGTIVPMWGYSCTALAAGVVSTASCANLNPNAPAANPAAVPPTPAGWSPVIITVPTGQDLQINLTNSLPTPPGATAGIPTSLVIVGQLGGGLGTPGNCTAAPDHSNAQGAATWPIAGAPNSSGVLPPAQGPRVQSFGTEVAAGTTASLCWGVTCATPTPALRPGTYLIESGTHPSIQGPMGLYGILVVTTAPSGATPGLAYGTAATPSAVNYGAEVPLLFSEIDPVQNNAVSTAVNTAGFSETKVWSGQPGQCGNPASAVGVVNTCYPPAVNYTPLYYLINGSAFNKTNASASLFGAQPNPAVAPTSGPTTVLVRMVNAGLRMHVPSIVGPQTGAVVAPATVPPSGFSLIAEDGNPLPGVPRVQSEVFMAAGKTYDVMINLPAAVLPVYDRELSLSSNRTSRDAGMLAYIGTNGATALPAAGVLGAAAANPDTYNSVIAGQTLTVSDPAKGVLANDINVYGAKVVGTAPAGLILNTDGTFTYTAGTPSTFTYCGNGTTSGPACALVTLGAANIEAAIGITMNPITFNSNVTTLGIKPPGILSVDSDSRGFPLTVAPGTVTPSAGLTVAVDLNGGFNASVGAAGTYTFTYNAQNSQGTVSASQATVTLVFAAPTNLVVNVVDGQDKVTPITDYRWIIEEDRTFKVDPNNTATTGTATTGTTLNCTTNPAACAVPLTFGTNFHTSYMPLIAAGCTGTLSCEGGQTVLGVPAVCDVGNGVCRTNASQETIVMPGQVYLDPTKRYYISVLSGDAGNPFAAGYGGAPDCSAAGAAAGNCGHGMGGAPVVPTCTTVGTTTTCVFNPVTVLVQPTPLPPSKLSVFVFEDDFPLNGEHDAGGGTGPVNTNNEAGLGGFNIILFDDAGGTGDATGQMTYDMFNQPLVNSLAGMIDPTTGFDACPISTNPRQGLALDANGNPIPGVPDVTQTGITGTIVTCPQYEADGLTPSPLAGQAVVANLMPGRYGVVATPAADRIARGEEWLQTNTLDGQKAHDSFLRVGEPGFFQEYGPAGYHVAIGFANPAIINARYQGVCNGTDLNVTGINCTNTVKGNI